MIADTTFLIDLHEEQASRREGAASGFLARMRAAPIRVTIISAAEFAAGFDDLRAAREFLSRFPLIRLFPEAAFEASRIDRELMRAGGRLGENDNWIAGIARYYGEPLISNDAAFHRVPGLRVHCYS
jgi:predicted nucleic acid-binding protein